MKFNKNASCCCCSLKCGVYWIFSLTITKLIFEVALNLTIRLIDDSVSLYLNIHLISLTLVQLTRAITLCAALSWSQFWCPYDTWIVTIFMNLAQLSIRIVLHLYAIDTEINDKNYLVQVVGPTVVIIILLELVISLVIDLWFAYILGSFEKKKRCGRKYGRIELTN